jgi:hypothetical protein
MRQKRYSKTDKKIVPIQRGFSPGSTPEPTAILNTSRLRRPAGKLPRRSRNEESWRKDWPRRRGRGALLTTLLNNQLNRQLGFLPES